MACKKSKDYAKTFCYLKVLVLATSIAIVPFTPLRLNKVSSQPSDLTKYLKHRDRSESSPTFALVSMDCANLY